MRTLLAATAVATAVVAIAAGCGKKSSSGGSNTVSGPIEGSAFVPKSSIFTSNSPLGLTFGIQSDSPTLCADFAAKQLRANTHVLIYEMGVAVNNTNFTPIASPGALTLYDPTGGGNVPSNFAVLAYELIDNTCNEVSTTVAQTGSVDVTGVSASSVKGKGTAIHFASGDTVDTTFALTDCPGLATFFASTAANACAH